MAAVPLIRPASDSPIKPNVNINGFTIRNGTGTDIEREIDTPDGPQTITEKVGGGLFVYVNSPIVNNCQFLSNGNSSTDKGGAVFAASGGDDIGFPDRDHYQDHPDLEPAEGPLDFSNNIFLGNDAHQGHSVYIEGFDGTTTDLSAGYFDVYIESEDLSGSSEYWIKGIGSEFDDASGDGILDAIVGDVYVNPDPLFGSDEENDGLSWESPFQTINYAVSRVYADSLNPATIYLAEGTFSLPTNGEQFPIELISWVNLVGQGASNTILDARGSSTVLFFYNVDGVDISGLTIQQGSTQENWPNLYGGGVACLYSDPQLINLDIIQNSSQLSGGGIYLYHSNPTLINSNINENTSLYNAGGGLFYYSNPILINVNIKDNVTGRKGGGLYLHYSNPYLTNVVIADNSITDNTSDYNAGGGLYLSLSSPLLLNVVISGNETVNAYGGGLYLLFHSFPKLVNTIVYNNYPQEIYLFNIPQPNSILVSYSDINGGLNGIQSFGEGDIQWLGNNLDENPLFIAPEISDYRLSWENYPSVDETMSPCIDAGTAYFEYKSEVLVDMSPNEYYGQTPDMGAFEWYPQEPDHQPGDVNMDGATNVLDVVLLVAFIMLTDTPEAEEFGLADMNVDGTLNVLDVVILVDMILGL